MPPEPPPCRRTVLARLAATATLLAAAGPAPAGTTAARIAPDDPRLRTTTQGWKVQDGRMMVGYFALPAKARGRLPAVIVIHDDRGLTDATRDLARRIALEGVIAVAPDFLTPGKGTPSDESVARARLAALDPPQLLHAAQMTLHWLRYHRYTTGRLALVGFGGWGAALVDRLVAVTAGENMITGIVYDPAAPDEIEWPRLAARLKEHLS